MPSVVSGGRTAAIPFHDTNKSSHVTTIEFQVHSSASDTGPLWLLGLREFGLELLILACEQVDLAFHLRDPQRESSEDVGHEVAIIPKALRHAIASAAVVPIADFAEGGDTPKAAKLPVRVMENTELDPSKMSKWEPTA